MNDPTPARGNQLPAAADRHHQGGTTLDPPSLERLSRARAVAAEHAGRRKPPSPPPDPGIILADIPRGADGTRFRIAWCEVDGHPFVRLAVWGPDGWPVPGKQTSVRLAELGPVLEGFIAACEMASGWRK